ncbi:UpxY family transcription antiterminator [Mesonia sp. MT50]|uniref:UpxY family transcription antiterminator n=1 Tax=Mesonia profundi TaxID=3070998 RepID=A0ABU1A4T9_9FLAO|nr:UpxY family transcription antiterminator [Mesonia profundi]MDQ7918614.1 UpxY family transcription antiterminator [Mesonia profundi]
MNWFVLYVKSRTEKKVATRLEAQGFTVFCPTKIEERQWSDRIKKVEMPYFTSYVFVQCEEKQAPTVLATSGVVRRLFWLGQPGVIYEREMQEVRQFFSEHKTANISYEAFTAGEEVYIQKGKLQHRKAVVLKNDKTKVTLSIPALGCAFKVTLPKNEIGRTS